MGPGKDRVYTISLYLLENTNEFDLKKNCDKLIAHQIKKIVKAYESYMDIVCNKINQ